MDRKFPTLCNEDKCTACSACANICKYNAISMMENHHGELHPIIDKKKCISCGLCERVCPELDDNKVNKYREPDIYYCWLKSAEDRKQSTSGGAGFAIAKAIIKQGGHVWGAAYDSNMEVCYIEANNINELRKIQKSKYVQSKVGGCFTIIKEELNRGEKVLFTGTPCHVKGLRSFLKKEYPNLLTVDLVCHGVPGHGIFRKYKEWLEKKYNDKLVFFDFRPKENDGQERVCRTKAHFKHLGIKNIELKENGYFIGFQRSIFLRNNCYNCTCKGKERYADITIADFWGLGKIQPFNKNEQRPYGISMLALNSNKGKDFLRFIQDDFIIEQRSYKEASISNTQYYESCKPPLLRDSFWEDWNTYAWETLNDKYLKYNKNELCLYYIKKFIPPFVLSKIKALIKWIK